MDARWDPSSRSGRKVDRKVGRKVARKVVRRKMGHKVERKVGCKVARQGLDASADARQHNHVRTALDTFMILA